MTPDLSTHARLVIGVGNQYREDDAVGLIVARRVSKIAPQRVSVREEDGAGLCLIDAWRDAHKVIVVDAVSSGAKPGTIHCLAVQDVWSSGSMFRGSTHSFGLAETIALASELRRLPSRLIIYGIEGKSFNAGTSLSVEVERAAGQVVQRVLDELSKP